MAELTECYGCHSLAVCEEHTMSPGGKIGPFNLCPYCANTNNDMAGNLARYFNLLEKRLKQELIVNTTKVRNQVIQNNSRVMGNPFADQISSLILTDEDGELVIATSLSELDGGYRFTTRNPKTGRMYSVFVKQEEI